MRQIIRAVACLVMAAVVVSASFIGFSRTASAAVVEIVVSGAPGDNATTPAEQGSAVDRALRNAVIDAAHEILPAPIEDARRVMLDSMLAERAQGFVISYAEQDPRTEENGTKVRVFDVQVNKRGLKQWLRQLGLFATAHFNLGYSRQISGATPEQLKDIDQLAMLMGIDQRPGVMPSVTITRQGDTWQGTLQSDSGPLSRSGNNLQSVWLALWGEYFAGRYVQDPLLAGTSVLATGAQNMTDARGTLTVRGWKSLDEVDSFDVHLKSWPAEAMAVSFGDVSFGSSSMTATWNLTAKQPAALKQRIDEYIAGKDLTYTLSLVTLPPPASEEDETAMSNATGGEPIVIEGASEDVSQQLDDAVQSEEQTVSGQTMQDETAEGAAEESSGSNGGVDALVDSLAKSITGGAGGEAGNGGAQSGAVSGDGSSSTQPKWREPGGNDTEEPLH
ncbi:hypothetical protein [Oceanidesulfovibrio marinus]|uniref:DUF2066 domain-containing protein n=2 Tax=Oceanidesulfovibrio marinus TaxID=370038 RepID=A0ABX6NC03_9BACT|nr:hypothetical protein [Oceanidesulfovibrio marinus]QJT07881.1 hypothetical protein E8L03_02595 [Oceanidesulfovibrio marinus]